MGRAGGQPIPEALAELVDEVLPHPFATGEVERRVKRMLDHRAEGRRAALADILFHGIGEAVMVTDREDRILFVNEAFTVLTGHEAAEVAGRSPDFMRTEQNRPARMADFLEVLRDTGCWKGEIRNRRKSGEVYAEWLSVRALRGPHGEIERHVSIMTDISERIAREEKLHAQAHHDALTALPNRILLEDRFERDHAAARRHGLHVAVLFIDLDGFKAIKDRLGHAAGDAVLIEVAMRLKASVRSTDTVCRHGGDEFVCLLAGLTGPGQAITIARKVRRALAVPMVVGGGTLRVTASLGVCQVPGLSADLAEAIAQADAAMYRAKREGKDICLAET